MAEAKVITVDLNSATVEIQNAAAGYKPAIGDQLIGIGTQPAIPPAVRTGANTFSIIGILAATGAALFAIGHHGQPAGAGPIPSPTSSGAGAFNVSHSGQTGNPPSETFTFTFSQPVNTAAITFSSPTYVSYEKTNGGTVITPAGTPVTFLGGPTPTFGAWNTTLTINATTLNPQDHVIFTFTSAIKSTFGVALTTTNITFFASVAHHPAPQMHRVNPVPPKGGSHLPIPVPQGGAPKPPPPGGDPKNPR
jgi:hypothetical protein